METDNGNGIYQQFNWDKWAGSMYGQFGQAWREREGQDHFYREEVVVPAVLSQIGNTLTPNTIIDLGCGDGYFTELIESKMVGKRNGHRNALPANEREIFLVDRDKAQLDIAARRNYIGSVQGVIEADLANSDWESQIRRSTGILGPLTAFSIFALQEMPDIYAFLLQIKTMLQHSTVPSSSSFVAVVVHPEYAEFLHESEKMKIIERSVHTNPQFSWASEYPITVKSGGEANQTILLPYFHRTILDYRLAAEACGLVLSEYQALSVPSTQEAVEVFGDTVYGESIIGRDSSALLTFHLA